MSDGKNLRFTVPLADGLAVEGVYFGTGTLCISSQAGCAVGCRFCASGSRGLVRNLSVGELQSQVDAARALGAEPSRLTVSGIGEPLHNFPVIKEFLAGCRKGGLPVSLTTCGAPLHRLEELLELPHNGLMLSLHAGTAAVHSRLVPGGPSFDTLWRLLDTRLPSLSRRARRRIGINYLLIDGVNDSQEEIGALAQRVASFPDLTVHLLSCNPVEGSVYGSPGESVFRRAHEQLRSAGLNVRLANRWRREQEGGCGTLFLRRLPVDRVPGVCYDL